MDAILQYTVGTIDTRLTHAPKRTSNTSLNVYLGY